MSKKKKNREVAENTSATENMLQTSGTESDGAVADGTKADAKPSAGKAAGTKRAAGAGKKNTDSGRNNIYGVLVLIGAVLVGVLLLLRMSFSEYFRFNQNGLAIISGTVTASLSKEPTDESIEEHVTLCGFKALEHLFSQGGRYYLGEKKKTQIDTDYPVFLNHGASLQVVNDKATLLDENFEPVETYMGLMINDGQTYNIDGERADAAQFLFLKLANGNFVNLLDIHYERKAIDYTIPSGSPIHFGQDYIAYYVMKDDELEYHAFTDIDGDDVITIGDREFTYDELLEALGLGRPHMEDETRRNRTEEDTEIEEPEVETVELPDGDNKLENVTGDQEAEETDESNEETPAERERQTPTTSTRTPNENNNTTTIPSTRKPSTGNQDMGVRPDSMRPDKSTESAEPAKQPEIGYVKPTVELGTWEAGVYRLMASLEVNDPASRIDKTKQIQFNVYEIDAKGKETLVLRSYRLSGGQVVLGNGSIRPSTTYRVVSHFTYLNEYGETVEESLGEQTLTTKGLDTLGVIVMTQEPGTPYNNHVEIVNVGYDEGSDDEAIYGIDSTAGIVMDVKPASGLGNGTTLKLSSSEIARFKRNNKQILTTLSVLKAKTTYNYTFTAEDYFGNKLTLTNNTGTITTSNSAPEASIKVITNKIDDVELELSIKDVDAAAVPVEGSSTACDVYLFVSKSRQGVTAPTDAVGVTEGLVYKKKLDSTEYTYTANGGLSVSGLKTDHIKGLLLDTQYYVSVYCDYDLSNNKGPQRFQQIGQLSFTAAGISSLGKAYVSVSVSDITCNSATIQYHLNTKSTNDQLISIIDKAYIDIMPDGSDEVVLSLGFDRDDVLTLPDTDDLYAEWNGAKVHELFRSGKDIGYTTGEVLASKTDYRMVLRVYGTYADHEYEILSELDRTTFTTIRKDATVTLSNLLFAAGTLEYDAYVDDEDDAITGNSGDKVVVSLYRVENGGRDNVFIKSVRIRKNQLETMKFTRLNANGTYLLRFTAVEYNTGYTNATYQANKVLLEQEIVPEVQLSGNIKMRELKEILGDSEHYRATTRILIDDTYDYLKRNDLPVYIRIKKDDVLVDEVEYDLPETVNADGVYEFDDVREVDLGDYRYTYTLFVKISGHELELDELEFTTEQPIIGFQTAYDMIMAMRENLYGKFVALNDIDLYADANYQGGGRYEEMLDDNGDVYRDENGNVAYVNTATGIPIYATESGTDSNGNPTYTYIGYPASVVGRNVTAINSGGSNFYGTLDFQGYALNQHMNVESDKQHFVTNMAPGSTFCNVDYNIYNEMSTRMYETGCLCYRNFGTIHDVYVTYHGGPVLSNYLFGLFCRVNCATGVVENFVINNAPEGDLAGVSGIQNVGLVTCTNYGNIRYGYVYGEDIECTDVSSGYDRRIGGICGTNEALGRVYSVYSMVNVVQNENPESTINPKQSYGYRYGAVIGYNAGTMQNMYSIGDSTPWEQKNMQFSPIVGQTGSNRYRGLYYYSPSNATKYNVKNHAFCSQLQIDNLYDTTWQRMLLTDAFDMTPVEVGYYPHVELSSSLPEQPYLPLPERTKSETLMISQASVESVDLDNNTANVKFVFWNEDNYDITGLEIGDLSVTLDPDSAMREDGYTTMDGVVYDPQSYGSEYYISKIIYNARSGRSSTKDLNPEFCLTVDFYRPVATADDWYEYVVKNVAANKTENVRLIADIDFTGVSSDRIIVASKNNSTFNAKLEGNGKTLSNINLQDEFMSSSKPDNNTVRNLFTATVSGKATISNLTIDGYKAGGVCSKNNVTYVAKSGAVFTTLEGTLDNVHVRNEEIESWYRCGGLVSTVNSCGMLTDCSVYNETLIYTEPSTTVISNDVAVGGLVAFGSAARIEHCFVRKLDLKVEEVRSCYGVGGVVGYYSNSVLDTVYATGSVTARTNKVGGIAGQYYNTAASTICAKNLYAKVSITGYTDMIGEMIGFANITQNSIGRTINITGIAFGNVYAVNPDSTHVSHTVGQYVGSSNAAMAYYGTDFQTMNGQVDSPVLSSEKDVVLGLLSYEALTQDMLKTYNNTVKIETGSYQLDASVQEGHLPRMYYTDRTRGVLPDQEDMEYINDSIESGISVKNISTVALNQYITVQLNNPNHYQITGVEVDKLKTTYRKKTDIAAETTNIVEAQETIGDVTILLMKFQLNNNDKTAYYLDSYELNKIQYCPMADSGLDANMQTYASDDPSLRTLDVSARVDVTMYYNISSTSSADTGWNVMQLRQIDGHPYENYNVSQDLDFSSGGIGAVNLKLGRLKSDTGNTIKNFTITNQGNVIDRLNSCMENLTWENVTVNGNTNGTGLIGTSYAKIENCTFNGVTVAATNTSSSEVGIIAHQNCNEINNITMNNVTLNSQAVNYSGGLVGYTTEVAEFTNITANGLNVTGRNYTGGLFGWIVQGNLENLTVEDSHITGKGVQVGGVIGRMGSDTNATATSLINVKLIGHAAADKKPTDADWSSTTVVETTSGSDYLGGVVGYCFSTVDYDRKTGGRGRYGKCTVTDCDVVSNGNYCGGAFGYTYNTVFDITVTGSRIKGVTTKNAQKQGVGGVIGAGAYQHNTIQADNVYVYGKNYSNVGGVFGQITGNNPEYYLMCTNSKVEAETEQEAWADKRAAVGGVIGYWGDSGQIYYSGAINTIVYAPTMKNVGGVAGMIASAFTSGATMEECFSLGQPSNPESEAVAGSQYRIVGFDNVGGMVGRQNGDRLFRCYSNMNVEATATKGNTNWSGQGGAAGGLVGYFNNEYSYNTTTKKKSYSVAILSTSYFAGSVTASTDGGLAGGAIGRLALLHHSSVTGDGYVTVQGTKDASSRVRGVTGASDEAGYTRGLMIIATSITGGQAGLIAAEDDDFKAQAAVGWEGTVVNGTIAEKLKNTDGSYRYDYHQIAVKGLVTDLNKVSNEDCKARLFTREDLVHTSNTTSFGTAAQLGYGQNTTSEYDIANNKYTEDQDYYSRRYVGKSGNNPYGEVYYREALFYYNLGFGCNYWGWNATYNGVRSVTEYDADSPNTNKWMLLDSAGGRRTTTGGTTAVYVNSYAQRNTNYRLSIDSLRDGSDEGNSARNNRRENVGNYLPQVRNSASANAGTTTSSYYRNDSLITKWQNMIKGADTTGSNVTTGRLVIPSTAANAAYIGETKKHFMPAANFSIGDGVPGTDSLESAYAAVYASDVDRINVEFAQPLVSVGYFELQAGDTVIRQPITKRVYSFTYDYQTKLIFRYGTLNDTTLVDEALLAEENLTQAEERVIPADTLQRHIMVYGDDYYYIDDGDVVSGAATLEGSYVHLMNGKALDASGKIRDVKKQSQEGTVSGLALLDTVKPLFTFQYNGNRIYTFARCSEVVSESTDIFREAQLFVSGNKLYSVDGALANQKDGLLLYQLNSKPYLTILGDDGILVDMLQDEVTLPEDVKNKAIVRLTNTIHASVPYAIIEYSNGGMLGYNYATGEILFDKRIAPNISLVDFVKNYITDSTRSIYHGISSGYSPNEELTRKLQSQADVDRIAYNSYGNAGDDTGDGSQTDTEHQALTGADTAATDADRIGEKTGDVVDPAQGERGKGEITDDAVVDGSSDADGTSDADGENDATDGQRDADGETDADDGQHDADGESSTDDGQHDADGESSTDDGQKDVDGETDADDGQRDADGENEADDAEVAIGAGEKAGEIGTDEGREVDTGDQDADEEADAEDESEAEAEEDAADSADEDLPGDVMTGGGLLIEEESTEADQTGKDSSNFMVVFNSETGMYEIVSVTDYLTNDRYISENERVGVSDLTKSSGDNGYAVSKTDKSQQRGIRIYILAIALIAALTGGVVVFMRKRTK
ncbi:MAG: hypothetical protein IJ567_05260 [Lachnospiraceae bacterium]|nr:hypothetical protein [Lachnospiraceae bacterium]